MINNNGTNAQTATSKSKAKKMFFTGLMAIITACSVACGKNSNSSSSSDSSAPSTSSSSVIDYTDLSMRTASGKNGAVTSANIYASKIGLDILEAGGNAYDAAVAMAFGLGVVEPNASGIGGGGVMVGYDKTSSSFKFYNFREFAPAAATTTAIGSEGNLKVGAKAMAVPTEVAGLITILDDLGSDTLSLSDILAPSIKYAEDGYAISERFSTNIFYTNFVENNCTEAKSIYGNGMRALRTGETVKNPNYAKVLKEIARSGKDGFYKGWVAEAIVAASDLITADDLAYASAKYPKVSTPINTTYNGYDVYTADIPSTGGVILAEALNMLEAYTSENHTTLSTIGHNTAEYIHLVGTALQLAYADKRYYVADNSINPADRKVFAEVPLTGLLSKEYAKDRIEASFDATKAFNADAEHDYGEACGVDPWDYQEIKKTTTYYDEKTISDKGTTSFSVVDKDGNVVTFTQTINFYWGSYVMPTNTGFFLNNQMADFSFSENSVNSIEPYKQPASSMAPTIILKDGKPVLTLGCPGSAVIPTALTQVVLNVLDFGMDIQTAIDSARLQNLYVDDSDNAKMSDGATTSTHKLLLLEGAGNWSESTKTALANKGYYVFAEGDVTHVYGITFKYGTDGKLSKFIGGADTRRDGKSLAY